MTCERRGNWWSCRNNWCLLVLRLAEAAQMFNWVALVVGSRKHVNSIWFVRELMMMMMNDDDDDDDDDVNIR